MLTIDVLIFFKFVYCGMSWLIRNAFWVRLSWAIYINMVYNNEASRIIFHFLNHVLFIGVPCQNS